MYHRIYIVSHLAFVHVPATDEYIDDFTPEDLVKYKLEINMEVSYNCLVQLMYACMYVCAYCF